MTHGRELIPINVATVALNEIPPPLWCSLAAILSPGERERAARFCLERMRREYIAVHALKRLMLSQMFGMPPHAWRFVGDTRGKPQILNDPKPHFSLSRCEGLVACAVSRQAPVGVDVERLDHRAPLEVAEHHFSPSEQAWLSGLPEPERPLAFLALWTMKEAIVKCLGSGMAHDLQGFSVSFDPLAVRFHCPRVAEQDRWTVVQQSVGADHILAVAVRSPSAEVAVRAARMEEMVGSAGKASD
jgi:4'-phosphopantetheinyl transferase